MLRWFLKFALGSAAAGALCLSGTAYAQPQPPAHDAQVPDYYDYYEVGYDTNYDDDWFFDYFEYDLQNYDPQFDYYTDYDYQADAFDWEERGLFDSGRTGRGL